MKKRAALASWILAAGLVACNPFEDPTPTIGPRPQNSPMLQPFGSCDELLGTLRSNLKEEMRAQLLQSYDYQYGPMADAGAAENGQSAPSDSAGSRQEGVDYSGTNNQEQGVDEADFVKTDGYYIYTLNGNRLEILGVPEFGQLNRQSSTRIEGYPSQMMIGEDKVVVFSQIYTWNLPEDHPLRALVGDDVDGYGWWYGSQALTKITVIDVSDRARPQTLRQLYLEGYYQTARKVDSSVRLVAYSWMDIAGLRSWPELPDGYYQLNYDDPRREQIWQDAVIATIRTNDAIIDQASLDDFVPQLYERFDSGAIVEHSFAANGCGNFSIASDGMSRGVNSILSMDLLGPTFAYDADHIIANWSQVYASTDTLILAEPAWDWWWFWGNDDVDESTNLHRFDISVAGQTRYTGSGRVDGLVRDQFSLSEQDDFIRVSTTSNQWRWWGSDEQPPMQNHVFVLAGQNQLETVGHIGGIAEGESIWATRFVGSKAYLVTFRQTDPLWTVDLSDPRAPRLVGELEVPGVSTYIHPFGGDKLLTIGYGGDENGMDWSTQISLFDVSSFAHPSRVAALSLAPDVQGEGWTYAWSEASWEHKAFQFWGPMSMLAIPLSTYRSSYDGRGDYAYEYKSQLALIRVDADGTTDALPLTRYDSGQIDHSEFFNSDSEQYWDWRDVRRSIFMGDYIYAISDRGVTAHRLSDLSLAASVSLDGSGYDDDYWMY